MAATKQRPLPPDPNEEPLADYGKAAIIVPLIIGGAVLVAIILLWHANAQKSRISEMARIEEIVREELRNAYIEMCALRPDAALEKTNNAGRLIAALNEDLVTDYSELKIPQLLLEAESMFMMDCAAHSADAEKRFDEALSLMTYSSGEIWQFGMLGRARSRYEQGRFEAALADLDSIMDRNPGYGAAYYWRALVKAGMDDAAGAKEDEKRARALDSWPPLRGFMQASCVWTRDILHRPENGQTRPAGGHSLVPNLMPSE